MYSLPLSTRSRTLSIIDQSSAPDATAFDPLRASSSQLSQRPSQRPLRQAISGQPPVTPRQARLVTYHAAEEENDPFHSFVSTVLLGKAAANNAVDEVFASPTSSTTSYASPDTLGRFDSPNFRCYDDATTFSTPASSTCPSRSHSDDALACSATADPLDPTALHHSLAQLDLAQASQQPPVGLAFYTDSFAKPASSEIRSVARPNKPVFPPPRSASEPVFNKHAPPPDLALASERNGGSSSSRRVSEAFSPATSSFGSSSEHGPHSPTTPTSPAFLEEPALAGSTLSSSPNRRRLALPKVDSSNLAAPSAPVLRPTNFWRHTSRSALNSPLAAPSSNVHRRSSLINTGAAGSDECTQPDDLARGCEGKVYGDRIRVQELLM